MARLRRGLAGRSLIVLADEPDEDGALAALAAGAAAYCNGHAAPAVLQQVAAVVQNGGVWIGQGLMKRLLAASTALLNKRPGDHDAWRSTLTPREQEVAVAVADAAPATRKSPGNSTSPSEPSSSTSAPCSKSWAPATACSSR